jgi:regulation of enolase protein 1 (concanavalin A-like superfamily)
LSIIAETGDINGTSDNAANMILQSANTDWTIETRLATNAVPVSAQNAGLVAYQDDSHFVKLVYTAAGFRRGQQAAAPAPASGNVQLYVEENGSSKSTVSVSLAGAEIKNNNIYLKLDKDGSIYTAYYSVDGKSWVQAGQADISLKDIQAGVMACQGVMNMRMGMSPGGAAAAAPAQQNNAQFRANFDWFRIKNR